MIGFMGLTRKGRVARPLEIGLDEHLSANFTVRELVKSQAATRRGIDNAPDLAQVTALRALCVSVLQPVRDRFGSTSVSSGLRVPKLNRAIGGSKRSQHCRGEAADFEALAVGNPELAAWIRDNLDFDQLILEFAIPGYPRSGWVHCSYSETNRRQVLTAVKRLRRLRKPKTVYLPGLVIG